MAGRASDGPSRDALAEVLKERCPEAPEGLRRDFVERLDEAYFGAYAPDVIVEHLHLGARVSVEQPARVRITRLSEAQFEVTIVALDFFGEFALLCGTLAARSLDIESGMVHTFAPAKSAVASIGRAVRGPRAKPAVSQRLIVDVFRVRTRPGAAAPEADELEADLHRLLTLVADGRAQEARETVERRLAEALSEGRGPFAGTLHPIDIGFDNRASDDWTAMEVRGSDTPGFLYALANALTLRGIYVQGVEIGSEGQEARDRFLISWRAGGRIERSAEQATLRLAVALIKQFTHFLPFAPDPARALQSFDQFLDQALREGGGESLELLRTPSGLREMARLFGSSAFLWEDFLRLQFEHLAPVLEDWRTRPLRTTAELRADLRQRLERGADYDERKRALNDFKNQEMLLADMRQILDPAVSLPEFSSSISALADAVVAEALVLGIEHLVPIHGRPLLADGGECPVAIFGLGKFGGAEMGYASDIEILVAYGGSGHTERSEVDVGHFFEGLVRELTNLIEARQEGIFHLDLRLRPHGNKGSLASPMSALREYYRQGGEAAAFERQALIKLRWVAGDATLGDEVLRLRDEFVFGGDPWDRADALHLRERQARELVPVGRFSAKYSRGALVEVEYCVQYLQLLHGAAHAEVRSHSTLLALEGLGRIGAVSPTEQALLREAYLFWRRVADGLRMVRGKSYDLLLPETGTEDLRFLARRLGYAAPTWDEAARACLTDAWRHRDGVRAFFDTRFAREC